MLRAPLVDDFVRLGRSRAASGGERMCAHTQDSPQPLLPLGRQGRTVEMFWHKGRAPAVGALKGP